MSGENSKPRSAVKVNKDVGNSPEDGKGPGADLALFAVPLPDHPEVGVLPEAVG